MEADNKDCRKSGSPTQGCPAASYFGSCANLNRLLRHWTRSQLSSLITLDGGELESTRLDFKLTGVTGTSEQHLSDLVSSFPFTLTDFQWFLGIFEKFGQNTTTWLRVSLWMADLKRSAFCPVIWNLSSDVLYLGD